MNGAGEEHEQQQSSVSTSSSTRSLSAKEHKKARHIRSEKKRRNEIRLGFERLSLAVPAIAERLLQNRNKRGRGRLPLQGISEHRLEDGDGDGDPEASESRQEEMIRSGAVSELEILTSTISHLNQQFETRDRLIQRLHLAMSTHPNPASVPPPHSDCLVNTPDSTHPIPIWEAKWDNRDGI